MIAADPGMPDADSVVRVSRTLSATPASVFDAWVNPARLRRWWAGGERIVRIHDLDPRVGGAWRISFDTPDGNQFEMRGVYREVRPTERLSFSWTATRNGEAGAPSLVVIDFAPAGAGTLLTIAHHLPADAPDAASARPGWESSLSRLARLIDTAGLDANGDRRHD